ncbi:Uncharacterised protein [Mycobacteroides abscessus subsp. abscessus]|uniref:hypothetical protein n=1 Tax=Mycobacteroides abscessus TaxID=36809 RepID=UPI000929C0AF|nr:hypothetical protein [Mycobacteroides abscessus]SIH21547.1 Uncharacterised protein [Mycobacteroides abscessus subsp. abscessus]
MTTDHMSINQIADRIDPRAAQVAVARIFTALAGDFDSGQTVTVVCETISPLHKRTGLPSIFNQNDEDREFWARHL